MLLFANSLHSKFAQDFVERVPIRIQFLTYLILPTLYFDELHFTVICSFAF